MNVGGYASECKIIGKWGNRVKFTLSNVDFRLLNTLRHVLLEEIPCLAFHTFRFDANDTILKHEHIMLQLRNLRFTSTAAVDTLRWTKDCDCESQGPCENCSIRFDLDVANPSTATTNMDVTTEHLVQSSRSTQIETRHIGGVMGIVLLAPGQRIKLTCYAQLGIGREHGKWVCVPTMIFQGVPLLQASMFHGLSSSEQKQIVAACPKKVFGLKRGALDIENLLDCTACDECTIALNRAQPTCRPNVELSNTTFLIKIETDQRHDIEHILALAFRILKTKLTFD